MNSYTKKYMDSLDFCVDDFIPCEVCGKRANDIHHIISRKRDSGLLNKIENIMAVCRGCHIEFGEKNHLIFFLHKKHEMFLKFRGVKYSEEYFQRQYEKYSELQSVG